MRTPLLTGLAILAFTAGCSSGDKDDPVDTDTDETDVDTDLAPTGDTGPAPDTDTYDYGAAPEMVTLEPGVFVMGSPGDEPGHTSLELQRTITITHRFEIGVHEVTQGQFEHHMGWNPSLWAGCRRCPVEFLTWHQAAAWTIALSEAEGLEPCYTCAGSERNLECSVSIPPHACAGYRLPTEAEWEYAARSAGADTGSAQGGGTLEDPADLDRCRAEVALSDGGDLADQAWFCGNSDATPGSTTRPVGGREPNASGLYDMLGNVWEYTGDWWVAEPTGDATDPFGPASGDYRTIRGAAWNSTPREVRLAFRTSSFPRNKSDNLGFRVARTLEPAAR